MNTSYILYTKKGCGYCVAAKKLLEEKQLAWEEHVLGENLTKEDIQVAVNSAVGGDGVEVTTVPQIIAPDGTYVGGYQQLKVKLS